MPFISETLILVKPSIRRHLPWVYVPEALPGMPISEWSPGYFIFPSPRRRPSDHSAVGAG